MSNHIIPDRSTSIVFAEWVTITDQASSTGIVKRHLLNQQLTTGNEYCKFLAIDAFECQLDIQHSNNMFNTH